MYDLQKTSTRKAILISDNEELFKSLRRSLKVLSHTDIEKYKDNFGNKDNIIILIVGNEDISSWYWLKFRKIALNPLIIIGVEDKESFVNRNLVFNKFTEEQVYIEIPFNLEELLNTINILKPMDQGRRDLLIKDFVEKDEYNIVRHKMSVGNNRNETVKNFIEVKDIYDIIKDDEIVNLLTGKIVEIRRTGEEDRDKWQNIAFETIGLIENILKRRNKKMKILCIDDKPDDVLESLKIKDTGESAKFLKSEGVKEKEIKKLKEKIFSEEELKECLEKKHNFSKDKIESFLDQHTLPCTSGKPLRETLIETFADTSYELIFKEDGREGIELASKDENVKLILLDMKLNGQALQGEDIAEKLENEAQQVRIIVLSTVYDRHIKGKMKKNEKVIHYVVKKELVFKKKQDRLRNISEAIIEDYVNSKWSLEFNQGQISLKHSEIEKFYTISVKPNYDESLKVCIDNCNRPVVLPKEKLLFRVKSDINEAVLEGTDWKTWGIFTKEDCEKSELKLLVGKASVLSPSEECINDDLKRRILDKLGNLKEEIQRGNELTRKEMLDKFNELKKLI